MSSEITNQSGAYPSVRIVSLVPVDTVCSPLALLIRQDPSGKKTYKLFLPAIRGCVAHDPPSTMLCFSSKKSAV